MAHTRRYKLALRVLPTLTPEILAVIRRETIRLDEEPRWPHHCPRTFDNTRAVGALSREWVEFARPLLCRRVTVKNANAASLCTVLEGSVEPGEGGEERWNRAMRCPRASGDDGVVESEAAAIVRARRNFKSRVDSPGAVLSARNVRDGLLIEVTQI